MYFLYLLHAVGQPFTKPLAGRMTPSTYRGSLVGVPGFSLFGKSTKRLGNQQGIFFLFFWQLIWYNTTIAGKLYDMYPLRLGNHSIFFGLQQIQVSKDLESLKWSDNFVFLLGCWSKTTANFPFLNDIQRARTFGRPHFQTARYVGNTRSLRRLNLKLAYHLILPF